MPTKGLYLLCTWWITLLLNQASSSNPIPGCDHNLTEQAGTILTPNYPNTYPNNVHCSWKISVATRQIISLKMRTFNLDFSDYVVFHDGPSAQSPIIGITRYTGFWDNTKLNDTIIRSTGPEMFIYFYSDYSVAASGFGASYWAHECKKFTYGIPECSTPCSCIQENTLYCDNFYGTCYCKQGWTSYDCSTDVNECLNPHTCEDEYTECRNLNGSYTCDCRPGLKNINGKCADSCSQQHRQCSHLCGATEDPHKEHCYCPIGMELSLKDNTTCVECSNWHYGKDCRSPATCYTYNTQSYNKTNGLCTCYLNWTSTNCGQDFNECSLTHSPCNTTSSVCENTQGSFKCWCLQGFESRSENTCRECGRVLTNSSGIIDTYKYDRYQYITTRVTTPICSWTILATRGYVIELKFQSFNMYNGYQRKFGDLEIYDGGDSKGTLLAVYDGMTYRGRTPSNVRTRTNQMHIAHFTSQYGYVYQYFTASYNTLVCPPFMYGTNCSVPCNCNQSNTEYCNNNNGQCVCKSRWTSCDCSLYKNECQVNPLACPDYSDCIYHNNGIFSCLCKEGLQQAANGLCILTSGTAICTVKKCSNICVRVSKVGHTAEERCYCPIGTKLLGDQCLVCQQGKFGPDCNRSCSCVVNNTASCDPRTGQCNCKTGWTSHDCSQDIDECQQDLYTCPYYSSCTNTPGDYNCTCDRNHGYENNGSKLCKPIETVITPKDCSYKLSNATGIIKSPNYPSHYYDNTFCSWNISIAVGRVITARFPRIDLSPSNSCYDDRLTFYDGVDSSSPLLGTYCYGQSPTLIRSTSNSMFILLSTGSYRYSNEIGFNGIYMSTFCSNFMFGESCANSCNCSKYNTEYCDNIYGNCICKPGWKGEICKEDVNECLGTNNDLCPPKSTCENNQGSYNCTCVKGYTKNQTTEECEVIGEDCGHQNNCSHTCRIQGDKQVCHCPDDLQLDEQGLICVVPYYMHGQEAGDTIKAVNFNRRVVFSSSVSFGNSQENTAYILNNGLIAFGNDITLGDPNIEYSFSQKQRIIAPFWANVDPNGVEVHHHLYEQYGAAAFGESEDNKPPPHQSNITTRVERDISKFHHLEGFTASSVLVVTWVSARPLTTSQTTENNTFQAVFVSGWKSESNGGMTLAENETSFVIYIYQQGKMNWKFVPGRLIQIGFSTGDKRKVLPNTDSKIVTELDKNRLNTDYAGVFYSEVGSVKSPPQSCHRYLSKNVKLLQDGVYEYEKDNLYKCPCTLERLGRQWELYEKRGVNKEIHCYAISMVAKSRLLQNNKRNKLCCYKMKSPESDTWQDWEQSWRDSSYTYGHVLINDPWPWVNFNNMEALENIEAHTLCCEHSPKLMCDRFYKIFPDMKCTDYVYFVPASALGDPHITTLDGFTYTMNGWGEYIMLEIPAANFSFQARTGRAETSDGRLTNATVFTALAARESTESSLQVQLAPNSSTMIVYINGIDYTYDFYETPDFRTTLLTISVIRENRMNKTKLIASFPSGVTIKVTAALKSLEIETEVDKTWMNQTIVGLLGNFNGNVTDEFTLPNGTVLPINMTEKDIFYKFAKLWEVTQSSSIFSYDKLENSSTYQHPEFVPMFLDEEDRATVEEANRICGNLSYACIYDYVATLDQMFAQSTKASVAKQVLQKDALENSPPKLKVDNKTLNTNGYLALTEGVESFFFVEVEDDDHDPVTIETVGNLKGTKVNQQEKKISVKPNVTSPITLGIRALDSKGAYSSIENIIISVCTNCSNHGHCDPGSVREFLSFYYLVLQCICDPAYTGINCESEVDACTTRPCSLGQNCTDLTAAQQGSSTTGYICGPCPAGYTDQAGRCVDEDECASDPDICDQQCTNTEGSYYCSCNTGYRLDQIQKRSCSDINECDEKMSGCQQLCVNTEGSYNCSCYEGYQLNNDRFTCDLNKTVIDKCLQCQHTCILSRQNGTSICQCDKGYVTNPNNTAECLDVDECNLENMPCSQTCVNTKGSFHCSCYPGFKLQTDGISCQKCELPNYGVNCKKKCDCKGRGSCDTVKGCMCDDGWTGVSCDVDENECADHTTCPEGFFCENTIGSFLCKCPDGYEQQSDRCIDVDECVDIGVNITCDLRVEVCLNTAGSYRCECKTGYARGVKSLCQDIDECELHIDGCQHICHNVDGKYNCQCEPGYVLRENRRDCISVKDLCAGANLNCTQGCSLDENNQPTCICYRGYNKTIENGAQLCKDIDECTSNETNKCAYKDKCTNTEGGYTCSCPAGFSLDNNGWNCLACTGDTWGINCQRSCSCGLGAESCSPVSGCVCKHGFTGFYCETDIDECKEGSVICKSNEVCVNIPGNASCVCQSGFKISDNNSCSDINECAEPTLNNCTQLCNNTEGSYSCSCHAGYSYNRETHSCEDIDECQAKLSKCQQICENTEGSYRCKCNRGLYLGLDGVSCVADKPCRNQSMSCSYKCANIDDKDTCLCPKGQNVSSDLSTCIDCLDGYYGDNCKEMCPCNKNNTKHCEKINGVCECLQGWKGSNCEMDVDECLENASLCLTKPRSHCINIGGTYKCDCDTGYIQTTGLSGEQCTECGTGLYGEGCSKPCQCVSENTEHCSNIDGACTCKQGWRGDHCQIDIDECVLTPNLCVETPNSHCVNVNGSFQCQCDNGFALKLQICRECDTGTFGEDCKNICSCEQANTYDCDNVDGACICKEGWRGDHCQIDIDECVLTPNLCEMTPHTHCVNTDGSFQCVCNTGYTNYSQVCQECGAGLYGEQCSKTCDCVHDNTEQCNNVDGSCKCKHGWRGDHCQILIDVCKDNPNQCSEVPNSHCENSDATYTCVCDEGYIQMDGTLCKAHENHEEIFSKLVFDFDASNLNLSSHSTPDYIRLKINLEEWLNTTLRQEISEVDLVEVIGISKGSLHVDFKTVMKSNGQKHNEVQLTKALVDLMKKNETLMIDNKPATISIVIYANDQYDKNEKFCDIRKKLEPCLATEFCVEQNERAICKLIEEEKNLENLIVGLSISLPLFILLTIAIGVLVWFCTRGSTTQHKKIAEVIELDTMDGQRKSTSVHNAHDLISNDYYNVRRLPRLSNASTSQHAFSTKNMQASAEYLKTSSSR